VVTPTTNGQRTDAEGRVRNIVGWECVHVAIDDATAWPTPRCSRREGHHGRRVPASRDAFFARHGFAVER
jgi:hypothetical protein